MNTLTTFSCEGSDIRTVRMNNESWQVLKDVRSVLGLSNTSVISSRLDEDKKRKIDPKP